MRPNIWRTWRSSTRSALATSKPYPALAQLRKQEPVHRSADLNAWVVSTFEHCDLVLHDDDTFSSDPSHASGEFGASVGLKRSQVALGNVPILGNSDPPDHTRLRAIVNRAFVPRAIEEMRPRIAAVVESLLVEAGDGPLEVMSALAEPLVTRVSSITSASRKPTRAWCASGRWQ